jgi:hypothetical protein
MLGECYREVYARFHTARDAAYARAVASLEAAGLDAGGLARYGCPGLAWDAEALRCAACEAPLDALDYQARLIPVEAEKIRQAARDAAEGETGAAPGAAVTRLHVVDHLPHRRITSEIELDATLDALRAAILEVLNGSDAVTLD